MEKELIDFISERVETLITTGASKQITKDAAQAWKDAVAADEANADEATEKLLDYLDGRPGTIDGVIAFAQGPAKELMGEEAAAGFLATQLARKEAGEKWCNCEACTAVTQILAKFGRCEL